jgi:hypothetical protein
MSVIPLRARCANCGADELLSRIADGDGICRACHLSFCDDNTLRFLQDVLRADVAYRLLVRSLRRLSTPSVGLRVLPGPLLEGLCGSEACVGRRDRHEGTLGRALDPDLDDVGGRSQRPTTGGRRLRLGGGRC